MTRTNLIGSLLKDLKEADGSGSRLYGDGAFSSQCWIHLSHLWYKLDAPKVLLAVKFLGRDPVGSQVLSTPSNLAVLLTFSSSFKHIPEASDNALRAIANALLLVPPARTTFLDVRVDGGPIVLSKLEVRLCHHFQHTFAPNISVECDFRRSDIHSVADIVLLHSLGPTFYSGCCRTRTFRTHNSGDF